MAHWWPLFVPTVFPEASGQDLSIWRTQFETIGGGSELDIGSGEILDFIYKGKPYGRGTTGTSRRVRLRGRSLADAFSRFTGHLLADSLLSSCGTLGKMFNLALPVSSVIAQG